MVWPRWEESRVRSCSLITPSRMVWCGLFKNEDGAQSRGWAAHVSSDHTEDSSCDFLTVVNLSYLNSFCSGVCRQCVCGTVAEGDFPYVCASSLCHFDHRQKISHVWMFTAAILFAVCVLCWYFAIHFLASLGLHLCFCHSSSHSCLSPVYISQIKTQKFKAGPDWWQPPWQPVGLTLWEAAANLSLLVYLLNATLPELRLPERGRCRFVWVAGTHQHLGFITDTVQPEICTARI